MVEGSYERGKLIMYFDNYADDKLETLTLNDLSNERTPEKLKEVAEALNTIIEHDVAHVIVEDKTLYLI